MAGIRQTKCRQGGRQIQSGTRAGREETYCTCRQTGLQIYKCVDEYTSKYSYIMYRLARRGSEMQGRTFGHMKENTVHSTVYV
jgi:hypothetical protein